MSIKRRTNRAREREAQKHFNVFGDILMGFYEFLEKRPKPSDQEVREEFIARESRWKRYCDIHKLSTEASLMFNKEVSVSWQKRYTMPQESKTAK